MDGQFNYFLLVGAVALQRLFELRKSKAHEQILYSLGAKEFAPEHYFWMRLLHITWIAGCIAESFFVKVSENKWVIVGVVLLLAGQLLRLAAIRTLGIRWSVRIVVLPKTPPIRTGIYKFFRHPNYLGVMLELIGLPMIGGCFVTATLAFIANALLMRVRIRHEEYALQLAQFDFSSHEKI